MTLFTFLHINVHISNSIEPTDLIFGTNIQQHKIYEMIKVKVTLTDDEGHSTGEGQRSQTWRCLRSLNASCCYLFVFVNV